ncbi:MAG: hypothetical protein QGH58_09240 [Arenicellales bacterium]|nr:hypothetical protein [Arenicellales bacterium]MDP6550976.1 hypothetical protein [Arenicellales bacterium]MDP6792077.1 hypothetical protein [Arenicellales bacterium]MDP6919879.1 hypothetical protein [Arenicellales bacterium]
MYQFLACFRNDLPSEDEMALIVRPVTPRHPAFPVVIVNATVTAYWREANFQALWPIAKASSKPVPQARTHYSSHTEGAWPCSACGALSPVTLAAVCAMPLGAADALALSFTDSWGKRGRP